jgi:hypothetical protein
LLKFAGFSGLFFFDKLAENLSFFVAMSPDTAHFHERSKLGPFEFINEVVDFVGTAHELGLRRVDSDLNFAIDEIVKLGVDHNVLGSLFEPVFDPDDFEFVWHHIAHSLQLIKNLDNFFLLGGILASKQV